MPELTLEQFFDSLDKEHPGYDALRYDSYFISFDSSLPGPREIIPPIIRKDDHLVAVIQNLLLRGFLPIVDQRLGMVFGVSFGHHTLLRQSLYKYHTALLNPKRRYFGPFDGADEWIFEGMGYYFPSEHPNPRMPGHRVILVSEKYKKDSFDKDVFLRWEAFYI